MSADDATLLDQSQTNDEVLAAIRSGMGHVYYGLSAGIVVVVLLAGGFLGQYAWLGCLVLFGILVGVLVDLYANGYTH